MLRGGWYRAHSGHSTVGRQGGPRDSGARARVGVLDLVHSFETKALALGPRSREEQEEKGWRQEQEARLQEQEARGWRIKLDQERPRRLPEQEVRGWQEEVELEGPRKGREARVPEEPSPSPVRSPEPPVNFRLGPASPSPLEVLVSPPAGFGDSPWPSPGCPERSPPCGSPDTACSPDSTVRSRTPPPVAPKPPGRPPSSCGDSGVSSPSLLTLLPSSPPSTLSSRSSGLSWSTAGSSSAPCSPPAPQEQEEEQSQPQGSRSRLFQEELDCEAVYRELITLYPRCGRLEPLFQPLGGRTRQDLLEGVLELPGEGWPTTPLPVPLHHSPGPTGRLSLLGLRRQLLGKLQTKLEVSYSCSWSCFYSFSCFQVLREEDSCLRLEWRLHSEQCRSLESGLELVARTYEIDKFRLQVSAGDFTMLTISQMVELGKIVSLLLSLSGRLVKVENALLSLDWNGVEEREELEARRAKLGEQLEEASLLKVAPELSPPSPDFPV